MTTGWFLAVTATVAVSGVLRHCIHLWGERTRYRHEQELERQRHRYGLLVLRQPVATEAKIAALLAAMPVAGSPPEPQPFDEAAFPADFGEARSDFGGRNDASLPGDRGHRTGWR